MKLLFAGARGQFREQKHDWKTYASPYDVSSVMQYGGMYYSRNGRPTLVDKL